MHANTSGRKFSIARGWFIWFLPAFFMFYQYGVQVAPNVKIHYIETHYLVNDFKIALLSSFYLFPYVLLQIPAGILVDNFDVRKILSASMLLFGLGTLCIYFSNQFYNYILYIAGHILMGIGASSGFVSALYLANIWIEEKYYRLAVSLTQVFSMLGVFAITVLFGFLLTFLDWSTLILINFIFCMLMVGIFWCFIRDKEKSNTFTITALLQHAMVVIKNKELWVCAAYVGFSFAPMIVLTNTWRLEFLETTYHLSRVQATVHNGFSIFGYMFGAPFFGILTQFERCRKRAPLLMLCSSILAFVGLCATHYVISNLMLKSAVYFFSGFVTGAVVLGFAWVRQLVAPMLVATGIGLVNMMEIAIGMILVPCVGGLLDLFHGNYALAATPIVATSFLAIVSAFVLWCWRNN